jgi:hypothetical protein
MKRFLRNYRRFGGALPLVILTTLLLQPAFGQWPFGVPVTPQAQRNALSAVKSQVGWVQNATQVAPNYGAQGYGNVLQSFEGLREAYRVFKSTLNPQQQAYGANQLAELDAGLEIISEAFTNYQEDVSGGRPPGPALRNMCRVMRQGCGLWLQELNKTCSQLHVGWG